MKRIRELRKNKNMTQDDLAALLNVQRAAVSKYERGDIQPSRDVLLRLSDVLDCSVDYLLEKSDDPMPSAIPIILTPEQEAEEYFQRLKKIYEENRLPQEAKDKMFQAFTEIYFLDKNKDKPKLTQKQHTKEEQKTYNELEDLLNEVVEENKITIDKD